MRIQEVLHVGEEVKVVLNPMRNGSNTPKWCEFWTGTIVRLNKESVTVRFVLDEAKCEKMDRYIDYFDIQVLRDGEWIFAEEIARKTEIISGEEQ